MIRPRTTRTVAVDALRDIGEGCRASRRFWSPENGVCASATSAWRRVALIYESVWENTARLAREYGVSMPV